MLRNYLKIAFRSLAKNRVYSLINTVGLALGMATFVLIAEYVAFERSVDGFHKNLPNLYRVLMDNNRQTYPQLAPGVAMVGKQQFGEIQDYCRIANGISDGIVTWSGTGKAAQKSFRETSTAYADGSFFSLFTFPLADGSLLSLQQPNVVAISETAAHKYFGDTRPIGKALTLNNQFGKTAFTVGAVYRDFPTNSDFRANMLFSLQTLASPAGLNGNDWARLDNLESNFIDTYLLVRPQSDYLALETKFNDFKKKLKPEDTEMIRLQPVKNMHLSRSLSDYYQTNGNLRFVYLLGGIALLILIIAWFNYINLSTAGALQRAKEVGVRKTVGAGNGQLITQFLSESLLLNLISLSLALGLISVLQQPFNQLTGRVLSTDVLLRGNFWAFTVGFLLAGTLLSGGYVAFVLTKFRPVQVLKGAISRVGQGVTLRQSLVVFQFSVSIALMIATGVMLQQLRHMQTQDLSMKLDQLLVLRGPDVGKDSTFKTRSGAFRQSISQLASVQAFCTSGSVPGNWYNFSADGITRPNPQPGDNQKTYAVVNADHRFLGTYGIKLVAGQNVTAAECDKPWNAITKVMINERAVEQLGFLSSSAAVGQKIKWGRDLEIVGVVKNYHHQSLKQAIEPIIFIPQTSVYYTTVRLTTEQLPAKIAELEGLFNQYFPGNPFDYFFVDERYNEQYKDDQQSEQIFTIASLLAIFIACLGLFGLATYMTEQRTKEIGVRKVLGASVASIVTLLSKDFLKPVAIAIVIASPIAWYAMDRWLQDFAYKIDISWWVVGLAGLLAVGIALATVSFQSIRAALMNPVKSLRSE
ncbi:ABC transporter permease [Spirosoma sp. BT702]|uniref:ABC transporter permease n=2 Tax=Spirosoma profusum TaxID=2771354 RepID=A0A926Y283_9BACT|nr:ABC transporter permease [Spirosoma profusum]